MKRSIGIVIIIAYQLTAYCQGATNNVANGGMPLEAAIELGTISSDKFRRQNLEYNDVKGNPLLEEEMLKGFVLMIDKSRTAELPIQYDIYRKEFFYNDDNGQGHVIDQKLIREIVLTGKEENYHFKRVNPRSPLTFYDVLYETDVLQIFCEPGINFVEGKDHGIAKVEAKFSRVDKFYVLQKGANTKRIKLKRKDLYKYFSKTDQIVLDEILADEKLSLKRRADLKRLFIAFQNLDSSQ